MRSSSTRWLPRLALSLISAAAAPALAADLASRLQNGEVVAGSVPGSGVRAAQAVAVVDAPPRLVRELLAGFGDYHAFVPRVVASRQVKPNRFLIESELPWPVSRAWAYVQVQSGSRDGAEVVTWKMINGTVKTYEGAAWIQPYGRGRSLLTYQMLAVPRTFAPEGLLNSGLRAAASRMVDAVRRQAARLLSANPGLRVATEPPRAH